ncbi:MAG: hypothetical protein Q7R68_10850 [Nitrospirales bacterium]|nr:hypothetical protein [Nitrospirales bacterium]
MTTAHLNFEVSDDGLVNVMEVYEGGFSLENPAHCFARALMKHAPEVGADQAGEPLIVETARAIEVDAHPILIPGCGPVHEAS